MYIDSFAAAAAAAVNAHDPDAVLALWAEPATYTSPATGEQQGLTALRHREEALFAGFSDLRAGIAHFGQIGSTGAMFVRFEGTHDGTYAGFPATGRRITLDMIAVVTFDHAGKAVAETVYLDDAVIATALAATPLTPPVRGGRNLIAAQYRIARPQR